MPRLSTRASSSVKSLLEKRKLEREESASELSESESENERKEQLRSKVRERREALRDERSKKLVSDKNVSQICKKNSNLIN